MVPTLNPWRSRNFQFYLAGRLVSVLGSQASPIAVAFAVLDSGHSSGDIGIILAAKMIPQVTFFLFGGTIGDRFPRRLLMICANIVSAAAQGVFAVSLFTGHFDLTLIACTQAFGGAATAFFNPASAAIIPQIVQRPALRKANGAAAAGDNICTIIGPIIGGFAVTALEPAWAISIDSASFIVSAVFLSRLTLLLDRSERPSDRSFLRDLKEGVTTVFSRPWLWTNILAAGIWQLSINATLNVLGPLVAHRYLGGASAWAIILAGYGIGLLVGSLISMKAVPQRPLYIGNLLMAATFAEPVMLGLRAPTAITACGGLIGGAALGYFLVLWRTALMEHVDNTVLGRVHAWSQLGSGVFYPLGLLTATPVAAAIGIQPTLIGAGSLMFLASIATVLVPDVRRIHRFVPEPQELATSQP